MAERNPPVKIYLSYSEKDKVSKTARQNIRDITAFLEQPDNNGESYAIILNPLHDPKEKESVKDAKKHLKKANAVLFLCGDNTDNKKGEKNTVWKIKTARELGCNVIVCSLDRVKEARVPGWLKKLDNKAKPYTWETLKEKTELHVEKKYKVFKDNNGNPAVEPARQDSNLKSSPIDSSMLEQYKIYKQEIEHQENAQQVAINAFITLNTAFFTGFLALFGVMLNKDHPISILNGTLLTIMGGVGFLFCNAWDDTLNYYNQILTAKQRVVNHLEKYILPLLLNSTEYYDVMQSPFNRRYKKFDGLQKYFRVVWICCFIVAFFIWMLLIVQLWLSHPSDIPDIIIKII